MFSEVLRRDFFFIVIGFPNVTHYTAAIAAAMGIIITIGRL
jgi:hypothetical protein